MRFLKLFLGGMIGLASLAVASPADAADDDRSSTTERVEYHDADGNVVPAPGSFGGSLDAEYNYGWATGTLYLNRGETAAVAAGGAVAVRPCALIPVPPAAVACAVAIATYAATAGYAYGQGGCLKVKHTPTGQVWPDTHYGDRCY